MDYPGLSWVGLPYGKVPPSGYGVNTKKKKKHKILITMQKSIKNK